jgi:hypothetical protein
MYCDLSFFSTHAKSCYFSPVLLFFFFLDLYWCVFCCTARVHEKPSSPDFARQGRPIGEAGLAA